MNIIQIEGDLKDKINFVSIQNSNILKPNDKNYSFKEKQITKHDEIEDATEEELKNQIMKLLSKIA